MAKAMTPKIAALLDKGLTCHKAGDLIAAIRAYDAVLKKKPLQPDALWLKGSALIGLEQVPDAVKCLSLAAKSRPNDAAIWNDLGMAQEAGGDASGARDAFVRAQALDPELPAIRVNVARLALQDGDPLKALDEADLAAKAQPHLVEAHNTRGLALQALGREEEALAAFAVALAQSPRDSKVLYNKANLLRSRGDTDGALLALERAIANAATGSESWADALMTTGLIHADAGDADAAMQAYEAVLKACPDHVATLINRGELCQALGETTGAEAFYAKALAVDPGCETARFNMACIHLLKGNWNEGWEDHEARWRIEDPGSLERDHGLPPWDGTLTPGSKLLVWGEQGLGDQILFASQINDLLAAGVSPAIEIDRRLAPLIKRSFPEVPVFDYDSLTPEIVSSFEAQVALGSLGRFLRRTPQSFPDPRPYLAADSELAESLRQKYLDRAAGRKVIGVAWNSINPQGGKKKSLPLEEWGSILKTPDSFFVSLQYGDVEESVSRAVQTSNADIFVDDEVDPIADFDAAAAQIAAMDLVVATSNTAVHLAGALGVPVLLMLPIVPNWRWGLQGSTSPWYQNVRIFRQTVPDEWTPVIEAVSAALRE